MIIIMTVVRRYTV